MSSLYEVPAKNKLEKIFVGWDSEKQSYFMKVVQFTTNQQEDRVIDQVGMTFGEINDVEILDSLVKKYSQAPDGLSPKMYKQLFDDDVPPELKDFEE